MGDPRGVAWLLWKVTWRRASGALGSAAVLAIGCLLLTPLALATIAAPHVLATQRGRAAELAPRTTDVDPAQPRTVLRTVDPVLVPSRRWNGHAIGRTYYAAGTSTLVVPGVPRMPSDAEYYASPDLAALVARDPVAAALFQGLRLQGTIADAGLTQPHELRAVVGVSEGEWSLVPVAGFGAAPAAAGRDATLDAAVLFLVLAMVWIPGVAFVLLVARLSATRRRQRAHALRLLGLSTATVRLTNAIEVAVVAAPAAALGALGYAWVVHHVTTIPGTGWGYFSRDADPGLLGAAAAVAAVTVLAAASAAAAVGRPPGHARPPGRAAPSSRAGRVGLRMLVGALVYLSCMSLLVRVLHEGAVLGMWAADAAVAVGLALAGPLLISRLFGGWARRVRSGGLLVGLRLPTARSSTSLRLGGLLAVVIVLLLGALTFMNVLQNGGQASWSAALRSHPRVPLVVDDLSGTLSLGDVSRTAPAAGAVQVVTVRNAKAPLSVVFGDCADLAVLAGSAPHGCGGRPQWIAVRGASGASRHPTGSVRVPGLGRVPLPAPSDVAQVPHSMPESLDGALLLPARDAAAQLPGQSSRFLLLVPASGLRLVLAQLSGRSPSAQFDLGLLDHLDPDNKEFPGQLRWITIGAVLALGLGALALWTVVTGEVRERSTRLRGLRVLGAPRRQVFWAHFWSTGAPVIVLGWAGVLAGCLACLAMYAFDSRGRVEFGTAALIALLVATLGAALTLATFHDALQGSARSGSLEA